jgi:hypothetical protein
MMAVPWFISPIATFLCFSSVFERLCLIPPVTVPELVLGTCLRVLPSKNNSLRPSYPELVARDSPIVPIVVLIRRTPDRQPLG